MADLNPEQLKKYNEANPPQKPKHGRFSPDGQFYLCTPEEAEKLDASGWNTNPFEHDEPYKPEDARLVQRWADIKFPKGVAEGEKVAPAANRAKAKAKGGD